MIFLIIANKNRTRNLNKCVVLLEFIPCDTEKN